MITRRTVLASAGGAALLPALARAAPAPATLPPLLSPDAMRGDLAILREAYQALHPGLHRYLAPFEFAPRVEGFREWAKQPRRPGDFFLALARLTARVRCGHSYPNPVNQSDAVREGLLSGRDRVPFAFRWLGKRMVVTRPLIGGIALRPGDAIEAIDGVEAGELLKRLLPLARADGSNDAKRVKLMEVDGHGRYGAFDVYRPLVATARRDGTVEVTVGGRRLRLPAMTEAERKAAQGAAGAGAGAGRDGWTFAIDQGVGTLTMPTWAMYNAKWDWKAFIDGAVDALIAAGARGLVVDLRANEGGNDCGNVLLERLVERPLALPATRRFVRYSRAPDALRPYLDTWDKSFLDWGAAAREPSGPGGMLRLVRDAADEGGGAIAPRGRRFAGRVAVLVGPACSSATFHFAQAIKGSGVATLVGEPTGGNLRGINGGAYFFVRLPGTGMEVDLPLIGYFPQRAMPDRGVAPDVAVAPTRADIAAGRDPALARARAIVTRG